MTDNSPTSATTQTCIRSCDKQQRCINQLRNLGLSGASVLARCDLLPEAVGAEIEPAWRHVITLRPVRRRRSERQAQRYGATEAATGQAEFCLARWQLFPSLSGQRPQTVQRELAA